MEPREGAMAKITASLFSALDGVVDPMLGNWHFPYFNDEMGEAVGGTHDADVMLFGRVTYDSFAGAWPDREAAGGEDAPFAKQLGDMRKVVASRSRLELTWRNSEQLEGDLVEAVTALKNDPGVDRIALSGSVSVVRQLLDAGLLDELHLFVHPATAGSGLRLFDDGAPPRFLKLLAAQPFRTGVVHLTYAPDPEPPTGSYDDAKKTLSSE
jgi:dihydrofolate reductase